MILKERVIKWSQSKRKIQFKGVKKSMRKSHRSIHMYLTSRPTP